MTDMSFREKIFKPYNETWKIIKLLQNAYKHLEDPEKDKANDKLWKMYMKECERLKAEYPNNAFVDELLTFLIGDHKQKGAGEVIAKMNQEELI